MDSKGFNTDKELFRSIARGDEQAFAAIFRLYFEHLYGLMLKYTKTHTEAEDIVQQTFVQLWEKRAILADIDEPAGWLFITARNEFISRFRKLRVSQRYQQYLLEIVEQEQNSPDEELIFRQKQNVIKKAIDDLPVRQKQAYLLSREQGLTYEEVAITMGLERATVKEHIARAVKSIKAFILANKNAFVLVLSTGGLFYYYFFS